MNNLDIDFKYILDEIEEIVYVSDIESYELLYLNKAGQNAINAENYNGKKCYKILQGKERPCEFCTNRFLNSDKFYTWEHSNKHIGKYYLNKDKLITINNKPARLEIAIDITKKEKMSEAILLKLKTESALVECIRALSYYDASDDAIQIVLETIGEFYKADRAYIFEMDQKQKLAKNTYEWCAPSIESTKYMLQEIPLLIIKRWIKQFKNNEMFIIEDIDKDEEINEIEYDILSKQNIKRLISAPIWGKEDIFGFIGVDNPKYIHNDICLLKSLSYFIIERIEKRKLNEKLKFLSYIDSLTGTYNRNKYNIYISELKNITLKSVGVSFFDINGLKYINDNLGHKEGDRMILSVSDTLKSIFKGYDIFRVGGDEFVVICVDIEESKFTVLIEKARKSFGEISKKQLASIGYKWSNENFNIDYLINEADRFMYIEKKKYYKVL